jgi:NO-binding membrane sensor protein with MHYT domain
MDLVQLAAILVSVVVLFVVLDLVRRKLLTEEYSFVWIVCALALLGLSIARRLLDQVALSLGIHYPPAALLLVLILFVFLSSVSFSVVVSRQRQQIERLTEDAALLEARLREMSRTDRGDEDGSA